MTKIFTPLQELELSQSLHLTYSIEAYDTRRCIKVSFWVSNISPRTKEAIFSMLDGNNTIVLIPTGGGKTVTFSIHSNDEAWKTLYEEVENSEFSENLETSENQFFEVFNSEFSILHYTQNGKLGVENLGNLR